MLEYKLYYWDVPFRGNFIQLFLEEVGAGYECRAATEIYPHKRLDIRNPGMAPPYLYDCKNEIYLAQMPAILMHLGRRYDYLPGRAETLSLALKAILDSNDLLMDITNLNGMKMWRRPDWQEFRAYRLADWMKIFEQTGSAHGLKNGKGFLLGSRISVADIATTALFGTMIHSFPELETDLQKNAPKILALCRRIESRPAIRAFLEQQRQDYGRAYCGGQIEASIRKMID
ncbi:MAG: glutathione S-transferase family protein [Gammaproteobacteria bacterium]